MGLIVVFFRAEMTDVSRDFVDCCGPSVVDRGSTVSMRAAWPMGRVKTGFARCSRVYRFSSQDTPPWTSTVHVT